MRNGQSSVHGDDGLLITGKIPLAIPSLIRQRISGQRVSRNSYPYQMSKLRRPKHICLLALAAAVTAVGALGAPPNKTRVSVSIPRLSIAPGERVAGFEFHVTSGRIVRLANAPARWSIAIDNDPSWKASVSGSIIVASAAVGGSFFRNCLIVEKKESLGIPFEIHGEIVVTRDLVKRRRIPISMRDITLTSVK
ncbi:MAG: hypothetical protein WBE87_03320 [Candidatus Acidiferrales bacterium]